jgi:hypothetical protein
MVISSLFMFYFSHYVSRDLTDYAHNISFIFGTFVMFFIERVYDWIIEMMVMVLGETCWNNEERYVVSQTENKVVSKTQYISHY